jgi:hypothetical protein
VMARRDARHEARPLHGQGEGHIPSAWARCTPPASPRVRAGKEKSIEAEGASRSVPVLSLGSGNGNAGPVGAAPAFAAAENAASGGEALQGVAEALIANTEGRAQVCPRARSRGRTAVETEIEHAELAQVHCRGLERVDARPELASASELEPLRGFLCLLDQLLDLAGP